MLSDMYYDRFEPPGVSYKGKLIGVESVHEPRGDSMCQEAMNKLKTMVKVSGEHKQKIILNISTAGVRILDERTMKEEYLHEVQKISFVSRDGADARAFGLVAGDEGSHKFFAIKTEKAAYNVVLALKELFETVLKSKQRQMEDFRGGIKSAPENIYSQPEPASQPEEKAAQPPDDIEDPSSLYAVPHKNVQKDIKQREESLAELARTVEVMQEGLHNMEEFNIAPPPPASARRTSREPLSPTPEVTLESPFVITAPAPKRPPPQPPSDPFQSQLMETQNTNNQQSSSASEDLFKEFGDTLANPLTVQPPQGQAPNANPFGPPMGSAMNLNAGYSMPMGQQQPGGFGMPPQNRPFQSQTAAHDPFSSPSMGASNSNDMFSSSVLQPTSSAPPPSSQSSAPQGKPDPFSDLALLGGGESKSGKDMFSGFKMAKPGEVGIPSLTPQQQQQQQNDSMSLSTSSSFSETSGLGGDEVATVSSSDVEHRVNADTEKSEIDVKGKEAEEKSYGGNENNNLENDNQESSLMLTGDNLPSSKNSDVRLEKLQNGVMRTETEIVGKVNENVSMDKKESEASPPADDDREDGKQDGSETGEGKTSNETNLKLELDKNRLEDVTGDAERKEPDVRLDSKSQGDATQQSQGIENNGDTNSAVVVQNHDKPNEKKVATEEKTSGSSSDKQSTLDLTELISSSTLSLSLEVSSIKVSNTIGKDSHVNSPTFGQIPSPLQSSSSLSSQSPSSVSALPGAEAFPLPDESFPSPNEPPPNLPEGFDFPSPQVPPPPLPQGFSFPSPDYPPPPLNLESDIPSPQIPPPPLPKGFDPPAVPVRDAERDVGSAPPPIPPRPRRTNKSIPLPINLMTSKPEPEKVSHVPSQGFQTKWTNFDDGEGLKTDFVKPADTTISIDNAFSSQPSVIPQQPSASISIGSNPSINSDSSISRDLFQQVPFDSVSLSKSAPTSSSKPSWAVFQEAFPSDASSGREDAGKKDPFSHPPFSSNIISQSSFLHQGEHANKPPLSSSLPVHEDPFADDPFAIDSPSAKKTFVLDTKDSSSLANTDLGAAPGSKQLTTSTGIPLIMDDDPFLL